MGILKPGQVFSRVEFEKRFKDPEVISSMKQPGDFVSQLLRIREYIGEVKDGEWRTQIYHLPDFGVYAAKGAFGRWEIDCYQICDFTNEKEARAWISSFS